MVGSRGNVEPIEMVESEERAGIVDRKSNKQQSHVESIEQNILESRLGRSLGESVKNEREAWSSSLKCETDGNGTTLVEAESSHKTTKTETPVLEPASTHDKDFKFRTDISLGTIEEEKDLRSTSLSTHLPPRASSNSSSFSRPAPPSLIITFTTTPKGKYLPSNTYRLKNSLLLGAGFLELANAGDFAANVWNQIPVPKFAAVLMGIGGTLALLTSLFAFWDAILSHENYKSLKAERQHLKSQPPSQQRDTFLDANYREHGTELVDRVGMDLFMGFGSVMVGVGTLMAIGGANPRVYHASNLLSGYIGNAPVAAFGLVNAAWSMFIFQRANRHRKAAKRSINYDEVVGLLKQRLRRVQIYAAILGSVGIIAGGASLATATHWEGYPILIPCIVASAYCNHIFRTGIGYDRALLHDIPAVSLDSMIEEIKYVQSLISLFDTESKENIARAVLPNSESLDSILEFLMTYDLFEPFCVGLLSDKSLSTAIFGQMDNEMVVTATSLLETNKESFPFLAKIAEETILETGRQRFVYRERWLLECLGAWLCCEESLEGKSKQGEI